MVEKDYISKSAKRTW